MNIRELLSQKVRQAMTAAGIPESCPASVTISKNAQFGDYQANGAMAAAKAMKRAPRDTNGDGKIGLEEAIHALQIVSGEISE